MGKLIDITNKLDNWSTLFKMDNLIIKLNSRTMSLEISGW